MLIHVDETGKVLWINEYLTEEKAASCTSADTFWVEDVLPEKPVCTQEEQAVLYWNTEGFYYEKEEVPVVYSDTQQIMQAITDLELLILEGGTINV